MRERRSCEIPYRRRQCPLLHQFMFEDQHCVLCMSARRSSFDCIIILPSVVIHTYAVAQLFRRFETVRHPRFQLTRTPFLAVSFVPFDRSERRLLGAKGCSWTISSLYSAALSVGSLDCERYTSSRKYHIERASIIRIRRTLRMKYLCNQLVCVFFTGGTSCTCKLLSMETTSSAPNAE